MIENGLYVPHELTFKDAVINYRNAVDKGLLKIFAKMGISTLRSYRGAQIFEAVGLSQELIDDYFVGTPSRIDGIGLDIIERETSMRHNRAFPRDGYVYHELDPGGLYKWRRRGEKHAFNPETVAKLQHASLNNDYKAYKEFAALVDANSAETSTLRGLFRFVKTRTPVPIAEVEPVSEIVKRFCTGAMSYGSISKEAHESLAIAMNRLGGKSNTGEGGEDPGRFTPDENGDSRRSAIKQVASGRFGVTSWYLVNADEVQIKVAQGAKPGEGGQLPGHKVDEVIAKLRYSTKGVALISPPPHHDI
jgi:glutamate synthase domain-containing protein 2